MRASGRKGGLKLATNYRRDISNDMIKKAFQKCKTYRQTAKYLDCGYYIVRSALTGTRRCPVTGQKDGEANSVREYMKREMKKDKGKKRICVRCGIGKVRPPNRMLCPACFKAASNMISHDVEAHRIW